MKWSELTRVNFSKAVEASQGVCLLPLGVIKKDGAGYQVKADTETERLYKEFSSRIGHSSF